MKWQKIAGVAVPSAFLLGVTATSAALYRYGFGRMKQKEATRQLAAFNRKKHSWSAWYERQPREDWWLYDDDPQNRLHALYLPHPRPTKKVVLIAHGYHGSALTMASYAQMFQELGYNVLMPDNRAHGESAGEWVNFGWLDRLDYRDWCLDLVDHLGPDCEIVLFGVSMGGAIVMMMSGEVLPPQVKAIIEDCGYSSLRGELAYQMKAQFHLPEFPFVPVANLFNHLTLGFDLKEVDSLTALKNNRRPIFFIHGERDEFVPTAMVLENYAATSAPKELWVVPNADHAQAFGVDPHAYKHHVAKFLRHYLHDDSRKVNPDQATLSKESALN
ncbi:alpha/beta hydrolase [Lapidilactobacillus salsurivasis]